MSELIGVAGGLALFGVIWLVARHTSARKTWGRTWAERSPSEVAENNRKRPVVFFGTLAVTLAIVLPLVLVFAH